MVKRRYDFWGSCRNRHKKVIRDHSTIGVVVITDGSVTGIERGNYIEAEERVIDELKSIQKPFVVVLNSMTPKEEKQNF